MSATPASLNTLLKSPAAEADPGTPVLDVSGLQVGFSFKQQMALAINHLDFTIRRGETLGLVGESGCGKSLSALAIMRLVPRPGRVLAGSIKLHGEELLTLNRKAMRQIRGNKIAMIFQDPMTALNPVYSVGDQLTEPLRLHQNMTKKDAAERAAFMLSEVGLPNPKSQLERYPHELSGGQRQRVMIAMALSCEPDLLIADEPTTALDVTIQAQILELMQALQEKYRTGILLITHDLGVIAEMAHRVVVMYAGDVVESGPVEALFDHPAHPYTRGLLAAIPSLATDTDDRHRLNQIPGRVPSLLEMPPGCRFQNRCGLAGPPCRQQLPAVRWADNNPKHGWRCHFVEQPT